MTRRTYMRYLLITLIVGLCVGSPGHVPSVSAATTDQIAAMNFAKQAVSRALNYEQGNRASLVDAQSDFTPEGWREFMKWLDGYVDAKGAPTHSSTFTITGEAVLKSDERGIVRLSIPGILKQQSKNAYGGVFTTTYRVVVDVELVGNPRRVQHLKVRTCLAKPCSE
jgi:hypothetical protein